MGKRYRYEKEKIEIEAVATVELTIECHPQRVEECHGLHTFDEDEVVDTKLERVCIETPEGEIDLTDRLTTGELAAILKMARA